MNDEIYVHHFRLSFEKVSHINANLWRRNQQTGTLEQQENPRSVSAPFFASWHAVSLFPVNSVNWTLILCFFLPTNTYKIS